MIIKEIGLLSIDEYVQYKENIKPSSHWCWLRSPGLLKHHVACVSPEGIFDGEHGCVGYDYIFVRPALWLVPNTSKLQIGSSFNFGGFEWTVIAKDIALCETDFGQMPFRKDWKADDSATYAASDVKRYLDDWLRQLIKERRNVLCIIQNIIQHSRFQ